jgi:uncharacterized repeat protein (TIGR04076 family)
LVDVRITVLERTSRPELIKEYASPDMTHKCTAVKDGQVWISKGGNKPEGFCEEAWSAFTRYVFALSQGGEGFWPGWIPERYISINSCNDGLRPVIFKLEAIRDS